MDVTTLEMKPKRKRPCPRGGQNIFSVSYSMVNHTVSRKLARLAINGVIVTTRDVSVIK
jgi:hypothetical protein